LGIVAQESRVDALTRLLGLVVLFFGAAMLYYTYTNASDPGMSPYILPVYYMVGLVLLVAGLLAVISKFK
jgi:uncharacterized membrane protein HdeD (DUF308 family)